MSIVGHLSDHPTTGASLRQLAALGQAGGAETGGISGLALWIGLLALLVIFLAIIMRAFGQRRSALKQMVDEPAERKPSLKEIKEARAQKVGGELADKEALIKARQARKGASRSLIEEAEAEVRDDSALADASASAESAAPSEAEAPPAKAAPRLTQTKTQPAAAESAKPTELAKPAVAESKGEVAKPGVAEKKAEPAKRAESEKKPEAARVEPDKRPELDKKAEPDKPQKTLREGLAKTRSGFFSRLRGLFAKEKAIDDALMGELEEVLLTADIGMKTSMKLLAAVEKKVAEADNGEVSAEQVWDLLRAETAQILHANERPLVIGEARPYVILIIGVNGVGKTTTIGKLASRFKNEGHHVALIAGDTFRAAAIDQLKIWGERAGCEVFAGDEGAEPSGVVFDGLRRAQEAGVEVILVDTAGRLHTKVNLVEELKKVHRVCDKAISGAPHETLLVLDANTGQNAINQADMFGKEVGVTGIALTKLDGTAKGGVVIGIGDELGVPVQFIGIGEQVEDLREFHADEFVDAVF